MRRKIVKVDLPDEGWKKELFRNNEHGIVLTLDDKGRININKINTNTGATQINYTKPFFEIVSEIDETCIHSDLCKDTLRICPCDIYKKINSW